MLLVSVVCGMVITSRISKFMSMRAKAQREVLVAASEVGPAVHRLRFAWPSAYEGVPSCCEGRDGVLHVHVRAPASDGVISNKRSRSVPVSVAHFLCSLPLATC